MGCKKRPSSSSRLPPLAPPQEHPNPLIPVVNHHHQEIHGTPKRRLGVIPEVPNPFKKAKMNKAFGKQLWGVLLGEGSEKLFGIKKEEEDDMELQDLLDYHELNEILLQCHDFRNAGPATKRQRTSLPSSPQFPDIIKELSRSDIDRTLSLADDEVFYHILPCLSKDQRRQIYTLEGLTLSVSDVDTSSTHTITLKWAKTGYVFDAAGWSEFFVERRHLLPGDEIELSCRDDSCLSFSVLRRATRAISEA